MEGLCTSTRDIPPAHFIFKIESFSTLASSSLEKYESCAFSVSNCKWKLVVYPNGNESNGAADHISLYLALVGTLNEDLLVNFSLFVYNHNRDQYLYAQDIISRPNLKSEIGFDKFLPIKTFTGPSNGYLIDDICMFGAEVFIVKNEAKVQCLSMMIRKPAPFKYIWKIENFSKLEDKAHYSKNFITRAHNWKILLYPKGNNSESGKGVSLFLALADSETPLPEGKDVVVEMKLRIVDQLNGNHKEEEDIVSFDSTNPDLGWTDFLSLKDLNKSNGYIVNDTCIVEAEVIVPGSARLG